MIPIFAEGGVWIVLALNAFLYGGIALAMIVIPALAVKAYRARKRKNKSN